MHTVVNKQILKNQLKSIAGSTIYDRGVDYYNNGQVERWDKIPIVASDQISIRGKVQGTKLYKTNLIFDWRKSQFLDLDCRCPYGQNCKHAVALGLEFIESLLDAKADVRIIEPKKISNFSKIDINKCYIVLDNNEHQNSISAVQIHTDRHSTISPEIALRQADGLTKAQSDLLALLNETNDYFSPSDYAQLFKLLQISGLKFYWNNTEHQLYFDRQQSLIKASFSLERRKNYFSGRAKPAFVLKLDDEYKRQKVFLLLNCKDYLIKIEDHIVSFYQLPKELIKILDRINLSKQGYSIYNEEQPFETVLRPDEIINLNQIIQACVEHLDLSTDLKPNFQIIESKKSEPCFLVDYQSKKDQLEIHPAIDYGFVKIKVARTVSRSRYRGRDSFSRMSFEDQDEHIIKVSRTKIDYAKVQQRKEIELYKFFCYKFLEYGFTRSLKCRYEGEKAIFRFLKQFWPNVQNLGYKTEFLRDELNLHQENFSADFQVDLNADNDWLYFDLNCYCGSDQINLEHLRAFVEDRKEFLKLESGRLLQIANIEELERLVLMLESFYKREKGGFEGRLYHAPELEGIITSSKYYQAKLKQSFTDFIKEAQSGKPVEKVKLPAQFESILRDYQKQGIDWFYFLRKYRFAGILADDMGLGKTVQALVLMNMEKRKNQPSIVICPKTLVYNWQNEAHKFIPSLKTLVVDGTAKGRRSIIRSIKEADIVITGYAAIRRDWEIYDKLKIKFNYCILDEAQFIKNYATKNAQIVKKVHADYRLALTGTPLENNVSEIWSIFDFLMPGFLASYKLFQKKFHNPIMKNNCAKALNHLRQKTKCFMLRRTKSEVLKELPPKVEQYSFCNLGKSQNVLYQEILINVKREIFTAVKQKGFKKAQIHILAGLTKLRQVCNHPVLLLKDKNYTKYESAKLEMFVELIDEIIGNRRKVLVFSQFTQMLDILADDLRKRTVKYFYLSGKTKNRQELVDEFNINHNVPIFLISLRAGGTGLNLTSADNVIIFDPWWNPSVENQAIDRTHRIGQKHSVNVYRLITKGTIEEKIVNLQEKKKFLFDNLVGESKDLFRKLTWDDVKGLFV
ncbi:MAG: DEAD/DEAH box helicase [Patescibacteria group bacterium]